MNTPQPPDSASSLFGGGPVQSAWADLSVRERLKVLRNLRHRLVDEAPRLAAQLAVPGHDRREIIMSEILPLVAAIRFLERRAPALLRDRCHGLRGRPLWLNGLRSVTRREPLGIIGIIGASNYPLLLAGSQALQALTAGNAVVLKPGAGGSPSALALQQMLTASGLPDGLLTILPDTVEAGIALTGGGCHKLIFTGSFSTGAKVLAALAPRAVPAVVELSGCDAVFVRNDADLSLVSRAIAFGLDWNESRTCIAPRRVLAGPGTMERLEPLLAATGGRREASGREEAVLRPICEEALAKGARLVAGGPQGDGRFRVPCILTGVTADMEAAASDIFAPLLSLIAAADDETAVRIAASCPYALGAAVFSADAPAALRLAARIPAGSVTINDLVAPTADPRTSFGGRGHSGFGSTRGAEGLLEMTTVKVIHHRKGSFLPHLDPPRPDDEAFFLDSLAAEHASGFFRRAAALFRLVRGFLSRRRTSPPSTQP